MRRLLPRPKVPLAELEAVKEVFARRQAELAEHAAGLRAELDALRRAHAEREQALGRDIARLGTEAANLRRELALERDERAAAARTHEERAAGLMAERATIAAERDFLRTQIDVTGAERDKIAAERDGLATLIKEMQTAFDSERDSLRAEASAIGAERDKVGAERDFLRTQTGAIAGERDKIAAERDKIAVERDGVAGERDRLASRVRDLEEALDVAEGLSGPAVAVAPRTVETNAQSGPAREGSPLKIIAVGAGRDGTLSLNQMIQFLFDAENRGRVSMHEYEARAFYDAFCNYLETQDPRHLDHINKLIADCPYDCIVGNGYAPILPLFAERFGGKLTLIHLKRADKAACVESLKRDCTLFPAAYRYYADDAGARTKRIAGFHYGEMDAEQWKSLTLDEKFEWYYDKTHALIAAGRDLFKRYVELDTEKLDSQAARRKLATIVLGRSAVVPVPTHLNAHKLDIVNLPAARRTKMQWLLGRMNLHELATDDVYPVRYFLEKFTAWTGYQITGQIKEISPDDRRSTAQIAANLDSARRILLQRLGELLDLRATLEARSRRPARRPRKSG